MDKQSQQKLGLWSLTALTVGAMVGGGIWSLPQNMANTASTLAIAIGWLITAIGMWMLTVVFKDLTVQKPELSDGVYSYAKAGFGDFIGFNSAWGYWVSAWIGNVSYAVLMFSALGFFFPVFGQGNTWQALIGESLMLWVFHLLVLRGVRQAAFINLIASICKIVPIVLFLVLVAVAFQWQNFSSDVWGKATELPLLDQVRSTMLVTAWVFVGVEGALVESSRAKRQKDVSRATFYGFALTLLLYVTISMLSMGIVPQHVLAEAKNPSMAFVLEQVIGRTGVIIVSVGLILSLLGAWLDWTLLCVQLPHDCAKGGGMPKVFTQENKNGSPSAVLWLTSILIQTFLVVTLVSQDTYLGLIKLAASCVLVPYLLCALYAMKLQLTARHRNAAEGLRRLLVALVASLYACWLLYAAGLDLVLKSSVLYALGIGFFIWARVQERERIFTYTEAAIALAIVAAAASAVAQMLGLWQG